MVSVVLGTILKVDGVQCTVRDEVSGQDIECQAHAELAFDIQVGDQGVFVGTYAPGAKFIIKRFDLRKFLTPLYEQDVMLAAGQDTFIQLIDDPFFEAFEQRQGQLYVDQAWVATLAEQAKEQAEIAEKEAKKSRSIVSIMEHE